MRLDQLGEPTDCQVVVALVDLAGFRQTCDGRSDRGIFLLLDRLYHTVAAEVRPAGGLVVKFMGDAVLVVFPAAQAKPAVATLRALIPGCGDLWADHGLPCELRIKAHTGPACCGPLGPAQRFDVIGHTVNELFHLAGADALVLSPALAQLVAG
jgi:adenylate cyclase